MCEGYSSGLYFSPDAVAWTAGSLSADRGAWLALGREVTGYEPDAAAQRMQVVFEAALWANRHGVGLVEADEAVEAFGLR